MLSALQRFLPLRMAMKAGPLILFEVSFLEMDDEDDREPVPNTTTTFGFGPEDGFDELDLRLPPLEDDDATSEEDHTGCSGSSATPDTISADSRRRCKALGRRRSRTALPGWR